MGFNFMSGDREQPFLVPPDMHAALHFGFEDVGLSEIVSFTTTGNVRSRAVMARIGMTQRPAR